MLLKAVTNCTELLLGRSDDPLLEKISRPLFDSLEDTAFGAAHIEYQIQLPIYWKRSCPRLYPFQANWVSSFTLSDAK